MGQTNQCSWAVYALMNREYDGSISSTFGPSREMLW
jgi:hypothetical protein